MNLSRPSSLLLWFTWHFLAAAAIVFIPLLLRFRAISNLDTNAVVFFIGLAIAYLVSVVVFTLYTVPGRKIRFTDLTATYVPIFAALFLALLFYQPVYSRGVIILSLILVLVCTLTPGFQSTFTRTEGYTGKVFSESNETNLKLFHG